MKNSSLPAVPVISLVCLALGGVWIVLSSDAAAFLFKNTHSLSVVRAYKDWGFALMAAAAALYFLTGRNERIAGESGQISDKDITSPKNVEQALWETETRYRILVEKLPVVIFMDRIVDGKPAHYYISPRIKDLLGYTPDEWKSEVGMWENSIHPDDREDVLAENASTDASGKPFRMEYRLRHRDGHYVWVKEDSSTIRDAKGVPIFWQGILLGVTEQKRAEEALNRRDAILKAVAFFAAQFLKPTDWTKSIHQVLTQLGRATGVSRVYIFTKEMGGDRGVLVSREYEWCNEGVAPQIDNAELQNVNLTDNGYSRWVECFDEGLPVAGSVRGFPPQERSLLEKQDILSLICIPIQVGNDWWGYIGFDDCKVEREWSEIEIESLRTAANLLGASLERRAYEEALSNSEISYRGLFDAVRDAIYIQDREGRFLDVNEGAVQMYGYPKQYFIGKTPGFLSAPGKNDMKKIAQAIQDAFAGKPQQFEFWGLRSNGNIFPKDVRLFKGTYFGEAVIIAVAQDITARKQAEDALQIQVRELSVLHAVALTSSTAENVDSLVQRVTDIISDTLVSDNCGVLLLNETQDTLIPHHSYRGREIENTGGGLPVTKGISGRVVTTRRAMRVRDVSLEPAYFEISGRTRSELCVPILSGSKIFGVLNVERDQPGAFTENDERLLNTIAGELANAMERIQLYELEKRRRQQAENLSRATSSLANILDFNDLLENILDGLEKIVAYDSASILLDHGGALRMAATRNLPPEYRVGDVFPVTNRWKSVIEERRPLIVRDAQKDPVFEKRTGTEYIRGWMSVGMFARDAFIGFINVDSRTPGAYSGEHATLIQTFANQAATAIEKVRLFELEKKRRQEAETVLQATTVLTNLLDLPSLHEAILEWLYKIAPYDSASILEIEGEYVRITATKGLPSPEKAMGHLYPADNILCQIINESGRAFIIDNCQEDPRFERWGDAEHIRGWMGVPLLSRGQVIGYLTLDSRTPHAYTQSDAIAAQTFAHQAATSLENAKLYTETKQRLEELEMVSRVSFALRTAKSTDEMLPILLDELKTSIRTDTATILLYNPERNELTPHATSGWLISLPKKTFKPNEGIIGTVFSTGIPHISREIMEDPAAIPQNAEVFGRGWGSIAVPIHTTMDTIGVIIVAIQKPQRIEDYHIRLMTTLAEIAGNAIYRSRLYERSEEQIRRLTTLREMDTAIASSLDLHIVMGILAEHLSTKMGVDAIRILIFNPNSQMLECFTASGFNHPSIPGRPIGIGEGVTSQILLSRQERHVRDIEQEKPDLKPETLHNEGFRSYYALPLFSKGATRGIIETYFRHAFVPSADWKDFFKTLAGQVTVAIDNAQLFENLQRTNQELSLAYDTTLEGWGKALELRDKETQGHTRRVTNLSVELARQMGIPESEMTNIRRGALLHDIGKMGVPDHILRKPGKLTGEEIREMRKHPQYAYDLLSPITYLRPTLDIAYCHHEWWNGEGYPRGLKNEEIPLSARIFAVVDVWDALLSDRPYRKAWQIEDAMKYITDLSGKQFDPAVVNAFKTMLESNPKLLVPYRTPQVRKPERGKTTKQNKKKR
jgi:PAS domain S-box-containing protein